VPLSAGTKLGPYEILAPIGAGGMGEVYRAHDSRLNRYVAIKVSAARFSERFEREAKAIAALNHPNICQIYDVGPNYLVMEFIEGESPKGPLRLDEVLRIARQIADALEAAHEKGITHRDLKPGNIKIKLDGTVKVLDFGLAKVGRATGASGENSPTLTIGMTEAGMILGTAAYMAPEQARGKENVDKRADIWAFGVVLYELLIGKRLFQGEDVGHTLAAVIMQEPDLSAAPIKLQRLLKRCLEKDPKKRLRDIGDVWELLDEEPNPSPRGISAPQPKRWLWRSVQLCFLLSPLISPSSTSGSQALTGAHIAFNSNRPRRANSWPPPPLSEVSPSHRTGPLLLTWPTSKERLPCGFTLWMAPGGCSPERRTPASRSGLRTVNRLLFLREGSYCEQLLPGERRSSSAMWARHEAARGPRMAALFSGLLVTASFRCPSRVACPGRSLHPKPLQMSICGRRSFRGPPTILEYWWKSGARCLRSFSG